MRGPRLAAALACGALLLSGCAPGTAPLGGSGTPGASGGGPGRAAIDVDTPSLRREKADAGIAPCAPASPSSAPAVAGGLPDLELPCFGGGRPVRLAELRGPLVVNVWASYCAPCRSEMPLLQQFHERYGDRVPVLGIDFSDPQTESAMALATRSRVTYPLVADTQGDLAASQGLRVRGLPTTALVDAQGRIAFVRAFEITSVDQLRELVAQHLGIDL